MIVRGLTFAGRFVLGLLSFVWFRLFRWIMRRVANAFFALRPSLARRWRPLGAQSLRNPLALPVFMTSAPRWNPHAILATAGPLPVRQSLTVDVAEARRSASSWSIVVYTFPGFKTVTTLDTTSGDEPMRTVALPPGRYWLGLRYYRWSATPVLPAVFLDGAAVVAALPISSTINAFYAHLAVRRRWFYFFLHYYVWVLLRYAEHFSKGFVEREYVPVGNPDTRFLYGIVRKGDRVHVEMKPDLLLTHDVYLTVYNRASLPVAWSQATTTDYLGEPCRRPGHYLIRVHPHGAGTATRPEAGITVRIERAERAS